MRKALWLALMLALFVPGFALLGALAASDNGERTPWLGLAAGAAVRAGVGSLLPVPLRFFAMGITLQKKVTPRNISRPAQPGKTNKDGAPNQPLGEGWRGL
jgi:hypothetical protein